MDFIISSSKIKKGENAIILDSNTYSGIKKIAAKVALDLKAVFGAEPAVLENKFSAPNLLCLKTKPPRARYMREQ